MFGAMGNACSNTSMLFLSGAAVQSGINYQLGLKSLIGTVKNCRSVTKEQMLLNNYQPKIEVDSQTYEVRADGQLLVCEPATEVPMAQRYFLF
jgi:urease subunit alpha